MTKLMLAAVAALSICFGAKAVTGDLLAHLSFDDSGDILKSTVGADGEVGGSGAVTWVTDETILAGLKAGDGAVLIPVSTHIKLPIPATLTSSSGKPWSISMKVKFPSFGPWYSIFTMPAANNDDMMVYLTQAESPGIVLKQSGGKVYGNGGFAAGQWETLLFLFDSGNTRVLLNGNQIFSNSYTLSGSRADCANAGGYILLAGDNDGEDSPMYWADVKVYDGIVPDTTDLVIHTVTWRNSDGTLLKTDEVVEGKLPVYGATSPVENSDEPSYFTGWAPGFEAVVSNTTYTAAFKKVADLSQLTDDWTAEDGDEIEGTTSHKVTIPSGATVTINGVSVAGAGGGAAVDAPEFNAGGEAVTTKFEKGEGGKWTITAFAEMSNESRGTDVTASQLKVYRASSLEGLKTAEAMTSGVTLTEKTSAVKVTLEAEAPTDAEQQFFRVDFGE